MSLSSGSYLLCILMCLSVFSTRSVYGARGSLNKTDSLENLLNNENLGEKIRLEIHLQLGDLLLNTKNDEDCIMHLQKAESLAKKAKDSISLYKVYQKMGTFHGLHLHNEKSIEYKAKCLKLSESIGDPFYITDAKLQIGVEYFSQKNYRHAIQFFKDALSTTRRTQNLLQEGTLLYLIAYSYLKIHELAMSAGYFKRAHHIIYQSGNIYRMIDYNNGLSELMLEQGKTDEALQLLHQSLHLVDSLNPGSGKNEMGHKLAKAYLLKGDLNRAKWYGNFSLNYYQNPENSKYEFANVLDVMSLVYEQTGDFKKALDLKKKFLLFNDSLTNANNQSQINQMMAGFQIEKKNQEIEILDRDKKIDRLWKRVLGIGTILLIVIACLILLNLYTQKTQRKKSDSLLYNILPKTVADELKLHGQTKARYFQQTSILFTDFKSFTQIAEKLSPEELVMELNACFTAFDDIIQQCGIEKIKTIGDAYMAVGGIPIEDPRHAEHVALAALQIRDYMENRKRELGDKTFEVRIGINSGEAVAGVVGSKKFAYDIWGDTVNIAARMEQHSEPGKINISESTYLLLKERFDCSYRGKIQAKNKGEINMYFLNAIN